MKKIVCLVLALAMLLMVFASCDNEGDPTPVTLATPGNVAISETGLITWDPVPGATSYLVTVGDDTYTVSTNSYQVTKLDIDFNYTVVAKADGYADSAASARGTWQAPRKPPVTVTPITVAVSGKSEVRAGHSITLTAGVEGTEDKEVLWQVTEGGEYAEIDAISGVLTAKGVEEITGDRIVVVTATSLADESVTGSKTVTVLAQPVLTQDMLDAISAETKLGFEGYVTISLYTYGLYDKLYMTSTSNVATAMDGEHWYASYMDGNTGVNSALYYQNYGGVANQVGVSFMNEEEYAPMLDDNGNPVSWEDAGLYNCFVGLTVDDFRFNADTWRYEYVGNDATLMARMVASANPYDFIPVSLALILEENEIMGIYAVAQDDYTLVSGYRAVQELTVALNMGDAVDVKTVNKFVHDDIHDALNEAIANMRNLTSYRTDLTEITATVYAQGYTMRGYTETVTPNDCYFQPFEMKYDTDGNEIRTYDSAGDYGYHRFSDTFYNTFMKDKDGAFVATRAYESAFSAAKPTFAFAGEIFTSFYLNEDGSVTYYVADIMSSVASTFYYGVGNDIALYGLFATRGHTSSTTSFTPYVTVKDGYITEAGFYYYMGSLYGVVELTYSDFNTATLPDDVTVDFTPRAVPTNWSECTIIVSDDETSTEEDTEVNALTFFTEMFGDAETANSVPFLGNVLGDCYGFGMTSIRMPGGSHTAKRCVILYYDVPLDIDYTIESSLEAIRQYLLTLGYTRNQYDEYSNGTIVVAPVDSSLDLTVYVWKA